MLNFTQIYLRQLKKYYLKFPEQTKYTMYEDKQKWQQTKKK